MSYQIEQKRTFAFLRLPFEAKRRRVRPLLQLARRLAKPLLGVAVCAGFVGWLLFSPLFELSEIELEAGPRVHGEVLRQRLASWREVNLFRLDLDAVRAVLAEDPWIAEVALRKRLPDRLQVSIEERRPVALWRDDSGGFSYLDAAGRLIAPVNEAESADAWLVLYAAASDAAGQTTRAAVLSLVERLAETPGRAAVRVSAVEILTTGDLRLELRGAAFPVLVAPAEAERQLAHFARLERPLAARGVVPRAVDLRFSGRVLVDPATELGKQES